MQPRDAQVVAGLLCLALANEVRGADTGITGVKLVMRAGARGEKLVFLSKDPSAPFPTMGGADDPDSGMPGGMRIHRVRDAYRFNNPVALAGATPVARDAC